MKAAGMLVSLAWGVNFGFWLILGLPGEHSPE